MQRLRPRVDGEETPTDVAAEVGHTTAPSDVLPVRTQTSLGCAHIRRKPPSDYTHTSSRLSYGPFVINTAQDSGESREPVSAADDAACLKCLLSTSIRVDKNRPN